MQKSLRTLFFVIILIIGLPLSGLLINGRSLKPYLEFPPKTHYINPAPFSWLAFSLYAFLIIVLFIPVLCQFLRVKKDMFTKRAFDTKKSFPWWGYIGFLFGILSWVIAWNRFPVFKGFQAHTFSLLWFSFIITINALTYKKTGHCLLLDRPLYYGSLFPFSALLWWLFEFLNRFVQNWYYTGVAFDAWEYFWYATLPFSTVLPAVIGAREWLSSFIWPEKYFKIFIRIHIPRPRCCALLALLCASAGLFLLGIFPDYLFALLWISPLILLISFQVLFKEKHLFSNAAKADWVLIITSALAALLCGFFWEMWNFYSLAKWRYQIPFVQRFLIFEMPILGYAGYLPFGLECSLVADLFRIFPSAKDPDESAFSA